MELHMLIDYYERKAEGCRRRAEEYAKRRVAREIELKEAEIYEATIEWLRIIKEDYRV